MAFWAEPGTEPKRSYRWIMRLNTNDPSSKLDSYLIKRTSRPSWSLTESQHVFLNHTFYYPGRVQYNELSVQIVDAVDPNSAVRLMKMLADAGYQAPDAAANDDGWSTVSKAGWGGANLGSPQIIQLDEAGEEIETWQFYNSWIKSCTLGDLDYGSDELLNVDMVIRYDYFKIGQGSGPNAPSAASIASTFTR